MTRRGTNRISNAASGLCGWLRRHPGLVRGAGLAVLALITFVAGLSIGAWRAVCRDCPSVAQIYAWEPKEATRLLDRDGKLFAELFEERRTPVEIETLPEHVSQAFVAIEDKRFYEHDGLDYRRIISANVQNVLSGRITGGGSTITQQLARNMFEEGIGFEQRVARKLKEFKVAKQIERVYGKETILEAYITASWWATLRQRFEQRSETVPGGGFGSSTSSRRRRWAWRTRSRSASRSSAPTRS
jgi:membrane carboxypeptidase/penicillin-binding protein